SRSWARREAVFFRQVPGGGENVSRDSEVVPVPAYFGTPARRRMDTVPLPLAVARWRPSGLKATPRTSLCGGDPRAKWFPGRPVAAAHRRRGPSDAGEANQAP